jgi:hypothetical protein
MAKPRRNPGIVWFVTDPFGQLPCTVLQNGLHVANYGSHHSFEFEDGTTLLAASKTRVDLITLPVRETELQSPYHKDVSDVRIEWRLTPDIGKNLKGLKAHEEIDVLIVPTPILEALKNEEEEIGKCRVCWLVSRTPKICSTTRFIR